LRSASFASIEPSEEHIIPLSALRDPEHGEPRWWRAYNLVKHSEATQYREGNLASASGSVAALAILVNEMTGFPLSPIFVNVGIPYPPTAVDVREDRILFNMD